MTPLETLLKDSTRLSLDEFGVQLADGTSLVMLPESRLRLLETLTK